VGDDWNWGLAVQTSTGLDKTGAQSEQIIHQMRDEDCDTFWQDLEIDFEASSQKKGMRLSLGPMFGRS
jgi:hypothetical protein